MGHRNRDSDCKSCDKKRHRGGCEPCKNKKQEKPRPVEKKYGPCDKCPEPICDCRSKCRDPEPLAVREGLLEASLVDGVIASTQINLNDDPVYRNKDFNVCRRREVVVTAQVEVIGGTSAQAVRLVGGVFYDTGASDYYIFDYSEPVIVPAGATQILNLKVKGDLDDNRILYVALEYLTGETPLPGAGVTYVPPTGTDPSNVLVSIYPSKKYPTIQDEPRRIVIVASSS